MYTWMIMSPFYWQEFYPPSLPEFLCVGVYELHDMASLERNVLETLDFDINIPTAYHFLHRYATVTGLGWGNIA